jgi:hypothetical protein
MTGRKLLSFLFCFVALALYPSFSFAQGAMLSTLYGTEFIRGELHLASDLGFKYVRYPLYEDPFNPLPTESYKQHIRQFLDGLEVLLPEITNRGFSVILDLHHPIGGLRSRRWQLFRNNAHKATFKEFWLEIAFRFENEPAVIAYELLNEPGDYKARQWNRLAKETVLLLRANGIRKPIIIGHPFDDPYQVRYLKPINAPDVWYAFHFYKPKDITFQGIDRRPGRQYRGSAKEIERMLSEVLRFKRRHNAVVFCTEFGCSTWSGIPRYNDNQSRWLTDVLQVFHKHGIAWIYVSISNLPWDVWTIKEQQVLHA